jgi:DUF4097 and DUF4098 domain-containing protein YvlB
MRRTIALAACIVLSAVCSANNLLQQPQQVAIQPSSAGPATETRSFALQSGGQLKVSNENGGIKVTAWDKDEVELTASFKPSSGGEHVRINVESKSGSLELVAKYPKSRLFQNSGGSCNMELKVPRSLECDIKSVNGGVAIDSVGGAIKTSTVNGSVAIENVSGRIAASTVNGSIKGVIQKVEKSLDLSTVNGGIAVTLVNPDGSLKASTVNGGVKLKTPGASNIEISKNKVSVTFGDGNASMKLSTVNGSLQIM